MKNLFLISSFFLITGITIAQDALYTVNNWSDDYHGVSEFAVNPTKGSSNLTGRYASEPYNAFNSAALGINSFGYLYSIPQSANGQFGVYSMQAGSTTAPTETVLSADVNGPDNNANVNFRRLGIRQDGWAYMISTSEDANKTIHFSRFFTNSTGGASDFQDLGTITLGDGSNDFLNGDLAFDGNGNIFVLVNSLDQKITKIYKASSETVNSATGPTSNTVLSYSATVYQPNGNVFTGAVSGLAFASNGYLYLTSQAPEAGIYIISKDPSGNILATATNYIDNPGLGDIASNYYPTGIILPVVYKTINSRILNGELQVSWTTSSEKNNSRFDVEVSKDGTNFLKIGTLNSRAVDGISSNDLEYKFSIPLHAASGLLGFSVFALAFLGIPLVKRRSRIILSFILLTGIIMFAPSCSKRQDQIDLDNNSKIFVRLVQYDIDGKKEVSKIITAYKAD